MEHRSPLLHYHADIRAACPWLLGAGVLAYLSLVPGAIILARLIEADIAGLWPGSLPSLSPPSSWPWSPPGPGIASEPTRRPMPPDRGETVPR